MVPTASTPEDPVMATSAAGVLPTSEARSEGLDDGIPRQEEGDRTNEGARRSQGSCHSPARLLQLRHPSNLAPVHRTSPKGVGVCFRW
jgi:hypothetical protein